MSRKSTLPLVAFVLLVAVALSVIVLALVQDSPLLKRLFSPGQPPGRSWHQQDEPTPTLPPPPAQLDAKELMQLQNKRLAAAQKNEQELLAAFPMETRIDEAKTLVQVFEVGQNTYVPRVAFSPDGKTVVCFVRHSGKNFNSGSLQFWDIGSKSLMHTISVPANVGGDSIPVFSPEGDKIALDGIENSKYFIFVWDTKTGKEIRRFSFDHGAFHVRAIAFLPDNQTLAAAGHGHPTTGVRWWNVLTGMEYQPLCLLYPPHIFAFSPDGQQLTTAGMTRIDLWSYPSLQNLKTMSCQSFCSVSYSANGKWLAVREDKNLRVIDLASGQTNQLQAGEDSIVNFTFIGDGSKMAIRYLFPVSSGVKIHAVPSLTELTWVPGYAELFSCSPGGHFFGSGNTLLDIDAMLAAKELIAAQKLSWNLKSGSGFSIQNKGKFLKVAVKAPTAFATDDTGASDLARAAKFPWVAELSLRGEIRDAGLAMLSKFKDLQGLELDELTQITDQGMVHLKHLGKLERLRLWKLPKISDAGLAALADLPEVRELKLWNLPGVSDHALPHLKAMTHLEKLELWDLALLGLSGKNTLPELPYLDDLWLSRLPEISNVWMKNLTQIPNLKDLKLNDLPNLGDAGLAHLKSLKKLKSLSLNLLPGVTGSFFEDLEGAEVLGRLSFWSVPLSDQGFRQLGKLKQLQDLQLGNTAISDQTLAHLAGLTNLQKVRFSGDQLTDAGLKHLAKLTKLKRLHLLAVNVTEQGLGSLEGMTELEELSLVVKRVKGVEAIQGMTKLRKLEIHSKDFTDSSLAALKGLSELQSLALYLEKIEGSGLAYLQSLKKLEFLDLMNTQVTDAGLAHLHKVTSLKTVWLNGTKVTDAGVKALRDALPKVYISR